MSQATIRTLVVGGGGFIGLHLLRVLSTDGRRRLVVAGRHPHTPSVLPPSVRYACADAGNDSELLPLLNDADEVIDLAYASVPKTSFNDPVHDLVSNLPATVNLLQKASTRKLRRYLLVSSGGTVYGNVQRLPIDESHTTDPVSPYGITKLAAEKYALMFHQLAGLPVVIVRPGNPYGPNQFGNLVQGFIGAAMYAAVHRERLAVFGEHGTVRDYIHIQGLCLGMLAALDCGSPGDIFNIGTGIGHDNGAVLDVLSSIIKPDGYGIEIEKFPARPFDVTANVLDSSFLSSVSGWRANTTLYAGLRATWDWVRAQVNEV